MDGYGWRDMDGWIRIHAHAEAPGDKLFIKTRIRAQLIHDEWHQIARE